MNFCMMKASTHGILWHLLNVFQEFELDAEDFSNMDKCFHQIKVSFKTEFKKVVHNNYIQKKLFYEFSCD